MAALWLAFVASAFHMGRLHRDSETASRERALHADADAIRGMLPGGSVVAIRRGLGRMTQRRRFYFTGHVVTKGLAPTRWRHGRRFYFTDHVATKDLAHAAAIEFVVASRIPRARTLTPDNRRYFLYRIEEYRRHRGPPWRMASYRPRS